MATKNLRGIKRVIENVADLFTEPTSPLTIPTRLNSKTPADVSVTPTGFRALDKALEIGGLPGGKITELSTPAKTSSGGGTVCIAARIASKVQRQQKIVTIIDMSHSFDPWQAERCGLVAPHLLLTRPDTLFDMLTTLETAARTSGLVIVVMDVVFRLFQNVEADLLKTLLRRLQLIVRQSSSAFLIVTALPKNDPFSSANYPPGFPLDQLADVRLWVQDENWTHKAGIATAYKANLTVIKNQLAVVGKGADIRIKLTSA